MTNHERMIYVEATSLEYVLGKSAFTGAPAQIEQADDLASDARSGGESFLLHLEIGRRPRLRLKELRPGPLFYIVLPWLPLIGLMWLVHR